VKTSKLPLSLLVCVLILPVLQSLEAAHYRRYGLRAQYNPYNNPNRNPNLNRPNGQNRPQTTNAPAKPAQPVAQRFKEIPTNTVFYFWVDRDKKNFPRIKISPTTAKIVASASQRTETISTIPGDTPVLVKKDADTSAGHGASHAEAGKKGAENSSTNSNPAKPNTNQRKPPR
jgi:hypothetical protein